MNKRHRIIELIFFLIMVGLLAFSTTSCNQINPSDVVERTRPPDSPWKYTPTENLSLTATSQYQGTQTQQAVYAEATAQVEATATAEAFTILSTATAAARDIAIMAYQYYEPFDKNSLNWREEDEDNQYWKGAINIQNGNYTWQVNTVFNNFIAWSDFTKDENLQDFDVAVKIQRKGGQPNEHCFGLLFRKSPAGFDAGTYILTVCDSGYFTVLYYDAENSLDVIQDWTKSEAIIPDDWNLIEISARGEDFAIFINHQQVGMFSDPRLTSGMVSIMIDIYELTPGQIEVDFFALQPQ